MQPNGQIIIAANIIQTQMHLEEDTTEDDFQKDKSQGQGIPGVVSGQTGHQCQCV